MNVVLYLLHLFSAHASLHPNSNSWVIQLEMFQIEDEKELNVQRLQIDLLERGIFASDITEFHQRSCLTHNPITEIRNKSSCAGKQKIPLSR